MAAVAVHGGDVRAAHAVVLEPLVKRRDARLANACLNQFADAVVHHGGRDTGVKLEAIRQVGGNVVLAAGDMNLDRTRFAKRDYTRVEPVHERAQGEKIQGTSIAANRQTVHEESSSQGFHIAISSFHNWGFF